MTNDSMRVKACSTVAVVRRVSREKNLYRRKGGVAGYGLPFYWGTHHSSHSFYAVLTPCCYK